MMKKLGFLAVVALMMTSTAHADTLYGLYADANYWQTNIQDKIDGTDRDYKDKGQTMFSASLEHPIPLVPNVRLRHTSLNGTLESNSNNEIKATTTDAIAYYELLDNVVSVDVGLGAKRIEGDITQSGESRLNLNKTLPMAYASAGAKLPFTGLSVKAEVGVGVGTNVKSTDAQAELKYDFVDTALADVGIKAGYRIMNIKYEEMTNEYIGSIFGSQVPYQMDFKGPYVGLEVHF